MKRTIAESLRPVIIVLSYQSLKKHVDIDTADMFYSDSEWFTLRGNVFINVHTVRLELCDITQEQLTKMVVQTCNELEQYSQNDVTGKFFPDHDIQY
jgi:maleate cis-trans isomerase